MLRHLTRRIRVWGATALALAYALCILAPAIVFAFGDGTHAVHCLIDDDHAAATVHMHQTSHATHAHHGGDQHASLPAKQLPDHSGKAPDAQCCGLAFTSALPAMLTEVPVPVLPRAREIVDHPRDLAGRAPDRLYKPPIPSLPI